MYIDRSRAARAGGVLLCTLAALGVTSTAAADSTVRSGTKVLSETTQLVKTASGKEVLRTRSEYNWDDGLTYHYDYDAAGALVEVRQSTAAPRASDDELQQAYALVWEDDEVRQIRKRQAGLEINGGFPYRQAKGSCAAPARCVQVFLFDGENVVKHMLVDLRSNTIAERNHVPPRNRED